MISAERVCREFGRVVALDAVSVAIPEAAIVGLLGPNGAGKTTLMRILTGRLRPSSGRATVAGCDVVHDRERLRQQIGVMFETQNLYGRLSVDENLRLFASIFGVPRPRITELLEQFGLVDRRRSRVSTLSHGMRQKVLLARAFLHRPRVLFLDEPTTGLDPNWAKLLRDLILDLRRSGATILLATHEMHTADLLCDTVAIIDQGRIVASDAPRELKRRFGRRRLTLERLDDGKVISETFGMDDPATPEAVSAALRDRRLTTLRTEDASLDDVFRELTGKSLSRVE